MKKTIRWTAVNSLFAVALYYALIEQVVGAQNIVVFYAWFAFGVSVLSLAPPVWKALAATPDKIPTKNWRIVDVTYDVAVVISLVWFGWMWTASAYLLHILFIQGSLSAAQQHIFDLLRQETPKNTG